MLLPKESQPLLVYDVECIMSLEPMQWNPASSRVDLKYTELFCIPAVISVSFYTCESVLGYSLQFSQAKQGSIRV